MAPVLLFRTATPAEDEYHKVRNSFRRKNYLCAIKGIKQYVCDNQHIIRKYKHESLMEHDKLTSEGLCRDEIIVEMMRLEDAEY